MKIIIEQYELQKAIEKAEKILHKATMPILESILLRAKDKSITLITNNLTSSIVIDLNGNIEQDGEITIDKSNFKLIKKLTGTLYISDDSDTVNISGNRELKFKQYDPKGYPEVKTVVNYEAFTIKENEFKDSLKIKVFASSDECKPIMCSCCINKTRIIAVDGFRLAKIDLNIDNKCAKNIVIPIQSIIELDKILDKKSMRELKFEYFSENENIKYLKITGLDYQYITRLIEGEYFKIDDYLPKEFAMKVSVKKDVLNDSLEFAKEILSKGKLSVVFDITEDFKVCGKNTNQQFSEVVLSNIDIGEQNHMKIAFNPNYLTDIFKLLPDSMINLNFVGNSYAPLIITGEGNVIETYMVLPVRIPQ